MAAHQGCSCGMKRHLLWLRADLRSIDNSALHEACLDPSALVAAVWFITPEQWRRHDKAGVQLDLELRTLQKLSATLASLNIPLLIRTVPDFAAIPQHLLALCQAEAVDAVFWNRQYEWNERVRDKAASALLEQHGIARHAFHDQCLVKPGDVLTGDGCFYSVFTPFKKNWLQQIHRHGVEVLPAPAARPVAWTHADAVPDSVSGFVSHVAPERAAALWPAGEEAALARLEDFVEHHIRRYRDLRDIPSLTDATSRLSPYLAIGAISPRQCWQAALNEIQAYGPSADIDQWISELGWREFYKHILVGFPRVNKHLPFRMDTVNLRWNDDEAAFQRWCEGKTGFPIVDAAMRQLRETGWMHNRMRMVTAMFLTKDLFVDWRWGERFFMQHLVDGDLAANNGGWQWSASTGNDAAPYFRIFNPRLQSEKFDPEGVFIRRFVPELAGLDRKRIHEPHGKQRDFLLDYPLPMVDHRAACEFTVAQFKKLGELPVGRADNKADSFNV